MIFFINNDTIRSLWSVLALPTGLLCNGLLTAYFPMHLSLKQAHTVLCLLCAY